MDESTDLELPWSKEEIIHAMVAEYRPFDFNDTATWAFFCQIRAFERLALGGGGSLGFGVELAERLRDGRAVSELEDAVYARLGRVWQALHDGRDPNTAYETPLRGEMH
jgi:hypothetical protein